MGWRPCSTGMGTPTSEIAAISMINMMYAYYKFGAFLIEGSSQKLSNKISEYIVNHDGVILKNSEVTEILIDNDIVLSVRLKNGNEYKAKLYISNADAKLTINKLIKNDSTIWNEYKSKVNTMKESFKLFTLYLGLNLPSILLKDKRGWYYNQSLEGIENNKYTDLCSDGFIVNIPSAVDPIKYSIHCILSNLFYCIFL